MQPKIFLFILTVPLLMTAMAERILVLELTVPGGGYDYEIVEVRQVGAELWVLAEVENAGFGTAALTKKQARARVAADPGLPVRQFVRGMPWKPLEAGSDRLKEGAAPPAGWEKGKRLYTRPEQKPDKKPQVWMFIIEKGAELDEVAARRLVSDEGAVFRRHLSALGIIVAEATPEQARKIEQRPEIKLAEQDASANR